MIKYSIWFFGVLTVLGCASDAPSPVFPFNRDGQSYCFTHPRDGDSRITFDGDQIHIENERTNPNNDNTATLYKTDIHGHYYRSDTDITDIFMLVTERDETSIYFNKELHIVCD